jgi:hypothetical protein
MFWGDCDDELTIRFFLVCLTAGSQVRTLCKYEIESKSE